MKNIAHLFVILIFCLSCSKQTVEKSVIKETNLELQMIEAYKEGLEQLKKGDVLFAAKKFNEAEILFPQSEVAPRSALMAAYSYYSQNYYGDAIAELNRFLRVYPNHKNIAYAEYLLGLSYYEQIVDETKDLNSIQSSKKIFLDVVKKYPNTDFAIDAEYKISLINTILAAKEMYLGRYYFDRKKWIASINRFKFVVDNYETSIYVEEALHRLVEIYYIIGLEQESKKYASLLGYNYKSSKWYENSYNIFDKNYQKIKIRKEENSILKSFKSLFN
ncbi:outer membrane protein assembly factor BamD [Candidatus Pelagibacter sp. HIMB1623]|uniref:outer membrane protein assembly factor BamD n=1 Tax=unclassified Candidatus Pelagibacter TaxID=2647897 RepID=UPI003F8635D7